MALLVLVSVVPVVEVLAVCWWATILPLRPIHPLHSLWVLVVLVHQQMLMVLTAATVSLTVLQQQVGVAALRATWPQVTAVLVAVSAIKELLQLAALV